MKTFQYVSGLPEKVKLEKIEVNGKRTYILPSGKCVPSVTTVLGHFEKKRIFEWRKKVGNEEANRISKKASGRGTRFHNMVEKYFENRPYDQVITESTMPDLKEMFKTVLPTFNRINNIHYIECPLYSEKMGIAGRCDLVAEFDNVLSIIDHKTSTKEKKEEWITNYLEQKTCYALMYEELYGTPIHQIVTIIVADDLNTPQIFIREKEHYIESLLNKIEAYHKYERELVA